MTDRAPSSALAGVRPLGQPLTAQQHARLGGEAQEELREVGAAAAGRPRAALAPAGAERGRAPSGPGLSSSSSRGRPSGVKCLRSLTVKDFSVWLISGRRAVCRRRTSDLPAPLHRSAAAQILAQVALPSADAALLALPGRPHPDPLAVRGDAHRAVPVRPQDEGAGAPVALDDLGVRVPEGVVRPGRDDGQPGARARDETARRCSTDSRGAAPSGRTSAARAASRSASPATSPVSRRWTSPNATSSTTESSLRTRRGGRRGRRGPSTEIRTPSQSRPMPSATVSAGAPRRARARRPRGARRDRASGAGPSHSCATRNARSRKGAPPTWSGWACVTTSASRRCTPCRHSSGATRLSPGSKRASLEPPASTSEAAPGRRAQEEAVSLAHVDHRQVEPPVRRPSRAGPRRAPGGTRARRPQAGAAGDPGRAGRGPPRGAPGPGAWARRPAGRATARAGRGRPRAASARAAIHATSPASCAGPGPEGRDEPAPRGPTSRTAPESGTAAMFSRTAAGARRWNQRGQDRGERALRGERRPRPPGPGAAAGGARRA